MVPKVLSSQLILQPALILLPEQEDLLFQPPGPTGDAWGAVGG